MKVINFSSWRTWFISLAFMARMMFIPKNFRFRASQCIVDLRRAKNQCNSRRFWQRLGPDPAPRPGQLARGQRHGVGVLQRRDGSCFEGCFHDGVVITSTHTSTKPPAHSQRRTLRPRSVVIRAAARCSSCECVRPKGRQPRALSKMQGKRPAKSKEGKIRLQLLHSKKKGK